MAGPQRSRSTTSPSTPGRGNLATAEGSLEWLYRRYRSGAYRAARSLLRSREDAEDVVQDVFVSLARKVPPRGGLRVGRYYIERAARNRALDLLRRAKRRNGVTAHRALEAALTTSTSDVAERKHEYHALLSALDHLPKRCGNVIRLALKTGWNQSRIAQELNISPKAVAKHYARARRIVGSFQDELRSVDLVE